LQGSNRSRGFLSKGTRHKIESKDYGILRGGGGFTNPPSSSLDRTEDPELAGLAAKVAGAPVVEGLGRG
jgi:hypothetical protein